MTVRTPQSQTERHPGSPFRFGSFQAKSPIEPVQGGGTTVVAAPKTIASAVNARTDRNHRYRGHRKISNLIVHLSCSRCWTSKCARKWPLWAAGNVPRSKRVIVPVNVTLVPRLSGSCPANGARQDRVACVRCKKEICICKTYFQSTPRCSSDRND